MARDDELRGLRAAFDFQCALVGNGNLKEESFTDAQRRAKEVFNDILNTLNPWAAKSLEQVREDELNALIRLYHDTIGDPDDPELRAKWEANRLACEAERREARKQKETEEERIDRLLRQREAERVRVNELIRDNSR